MALINCPACGKQVSDRAEKCPHCGAILATALEENNSEDTIKCEECGAVLAPDATVCPNCGCPVEKEHNQVINEKTTQLSEDADTDTGIPQKETSEPPASQIKAPQKKTSNVKIIIAAVAVLIIAAAAIYIGTAKSRAYSQAKKKYDAGEFNTAYEEFTELGEYQDAKTLADDSMYHMADADYAEENFESAKEKFDSIAAYKDSADRSKDCEYQLSAKGRFLRELSKGLMERWDQGEADEKSGALEDEAGCMANYCDIELRHLESFENEQFDDEQLKKDALEYIKLLRDAKEATTYYTVDYNKYSVDWSNTYNKRTQLLQKIVNEYGLTVEENYQKTLNDLLRDASASAKLDAAKEEIRKMTDSFEITSTEDEDGYRTYKIHMENTTKYTFEYFYVEISLLDEDGGIVDTGNIDEVTNWAPGQTADVEAWLSNESDPSAYTISYYPHYNTTDDTIFD